MESGGVNQASGRGMMEVCMGGITGKERWNQDLSLPPVYRDTLFDIVVCGGPIALHSAILARTVLSPLPRLYGGIDASVGLQRLHQGSL